MHFEKVILFDSFDDKDPKLTALFLFFFIYLYFVLFFWMHSHNRVELGWLALYTRCYRLSVQLRKRTRDDSDIDVQNKGSVTIECMSRSILNNLKIQPLT